MPCWSDLLRSTGEGEGDVVCWAAMGMVVEVGEGSGWLSARRGEERGQHAPLSFALGLKRRASWRKDGWYVVLGGGSRAIC